MILNLPYITPEINRLGTETTAMAQQKGLKRAQKVLKRKQRIARDSYRTNLKSAIYARLKALNACGEKCENPEHNH